MIVRSIWLVFGVLFSIACSSKEEREAYPGGLEAWASMSSSQDDRNDGRNNEAGSSGMGSGDSSNGGSEDGGTAAIDEPTDDQPADDQAVDGGSASPDNSGASTIPPDSDQVPTLLVGSWLHPVGDCSYTHSFDTAGIYTMTSTTGEQVLADYSLTAPTTDGNRWQLDFTITSDNNAVDCEGHQNDETGTSRSIFIAFPSTNELDVFPSPAGGSPFFSWDRL